VPQDNGPFSILLSDGVETLSSDGQGGLWVGTMAGLSHYQSNGKWTTIFGVGDFGLPDIWVTSFWSDNQGGLWVGTRGDLFGAYGGYLYYRNATNQWSVFDTNNSPLPVNGGIETLLEDGHGGLWIGTAMSQTEGQFVGGGLVHRDANGEWTVFNSDNSGLPHNYISSLLSDGQGGLWAGTLGGGLVHLSANGEWTVSSNPHIPSKGVTSLVSDRKNGLWVGSFWGVSHFNTNQEWVTPEAGETDIPGNRIASLLTDGQGGLWLGTFGDGLAYRTADNQWTIFDTRSSFPTNGILALAADDKGGLWIGSGADKGLIHRQADGTLTVFNTENSPLPYDNVLALLNDGQEGVWVGTVQNPDPADKLVGGGLARLHGNGQWTIFNTKNSQLPDDVVSTLLSDGQHGLWIGSIGNFSLEEGTVGGLAHLTADNQWTIFNLENSSLPSNRIETLLSDGQNGLWIGTSYWI